MQYELIFRGSLVQYWKRIHAEWQRTSRNDSLAHKPFTLSHPHPPQEFEEVTIEFLDHQHRLGLITVDALSGSDGKLVKLIVHISQESYEEEGKYAFAKWNKLKTAWERKGWLSDPLARSFQRLSKPKEPSKPKKGSRLELWFDYYHHMHALGFHYTLRDIASDVSLSYGHVRQLHANYLKAHGPQDRQKRPDKN